jgi:hypothetical protein
VIRGRAAVVIGGRAAVVVHGRSEGLRAPCGVQEKKDFRRQLKSGEGGGGRQVQEMGGGEDVTLQSEALF